MPVCRTCGQQFQWGNWDGKWVMLEPLVSHAGMDRAYIDEHGTYRADHRDRHPNGESVNVTRLEYRVKSEEVLVHTDESIGEAQDAIASETGWFEKMKGKVTRD